MKVRVPETMPDDFFGFYGDRKRYPGDEFELVERTSSDGKLTLTPDEQFSSKWMERMEEPRRAPGRPPKVDVD